MDEVDWAILSILQKNSRLSAQKVGELVDLLFLAAKLLGMSPENDLAQTSSAQADFVSLIHAAFCAFPFDSQSQAGKEQCYFLLASLLFEPDNSFVKCREYLICQQQCLTDQAKGKRVGLTRETVRNRINNLKNRGIIEAYLTCIDYQKIDPKQITYLTVRIKRSDLHESFLNVDRSPEEVREYHRMGGGPVCYLLRIETGDVTTTDLFIRELEAIYAKSSGIRYQVIPDRETATEVINEKDKAILKVLAQKGLAQKRHEIPPNLLQWTEIAHEVRNIYGIKITDKLVEERVRKLEEKKIILGHTICINPQHAIAKKVTYLVVLKPFSSDEGFQQFLECRRRRGELREYYHIAEKQTLPEKDDKDVCYLLRVETIDNMALDHFINDLRGLCANDRPYSVITSPIIKEGVID